MDGEELKDKDGNVTADQTGVGEANTTGDSTGKNDTGSNSKKEESKEKTFTQNQVNLMMTKEKKQGREAAFREMGIDPNDTKMVAMFKAFIDSQKTDEQKSNEEAAKQAAKIAEAEHRAMLAEAKAEAMMLDVKPEYVDDAIVIALSKSEDGKDLKSIIGELKNKYPIWFGSDSTGTDNSDKSKTGQKGTGASIKNGSKESSSSETKGMGARLAAQRKTSLGSNKKSFWS